MCVDVVALCSFQIRGNISPGFMEFNCREFGILTNYNPHFSGAKSFVIPAHLWWEWAQEKVMRNYIVSLFPLCGILKSQLLTRLVNHILYKYIDKYQCIFS